MMPSTDIQHLLYRIFQQLAQFFCSLVYFCSVSNSNQYHIFRNIAITISETWHEAFYNNSRN